MKRKASPRRRKDHHNVYVIELDGRVLNHDAMSVFMYGWQWTPLACITAAFLATMAVLALWRRRAQRDDARHPGSRHPIQRDLLRNPGESQRDRIAIAAWDAAEYAALGLYLVPLAFCVYPLNAVYDGALPEQETLAAFIAGAVILEAWILARLWRVLARARRFARAYEAEGAAGQ